MAVQSTDGTKRTQYPESARGSSVVTGFPAESLCLEFTEQCYDMEIGKLREMVDYFHSIGVKVALDNVTVQCPAIGVLLELPIDEIKLDRQFVKEVPIRKSNQVLLSMLMEASRSFQFDLCFGGIEDKAAHEYFKQYMGMNYQGFYYAMPMLSSEFDKL